MMDFCATLRQAIVRSSVVLALALPLAPPASAVVVYVGGQPFDLLVTNRSRDQEPALFAVTSMPWFTGDPMDPTLAFDFAQAVNDQLGLNTYPGFPAPGGPLFAFATDPTRVFAAFQDATDLNVQNEIQVSTAQSFNYAYLNPTPVPAPLPFAAVAAVLGWSRSLRARLHR